MSDEQVEKLAETIIITVDGEERTLRMVFGLLRELAMVVGSLENLTHTILMPEGELAIMNVVLAKREANGRPVEGGAYDASYCEISMEDREALIQWVSGHLISFFMTRVLGLEKTFGRHAPELERLNSFKNGLASSGGKTQPAGRSK